MAHDLLFVTSKMFLSDMLWKTWGAWGMMGDGGGVATTISVDMCVFLAFLRDHCS